MKPIKNVLAAITILLLTMSFINIEDWYLFESKDFSIEFPIKPTFSTQEIETEIGNLKMDILAYDGSNDADGSFVCNLITTEYPDSIIHSGKTEILEEFFRSSIDGAVEATEGKLLSEKEIEINSFPGREIKIKFQNGLAIMKTKMYLINNKCFFLQTVTKSGKDENPAVDKFHGSFKLK